MRGEMGVEMGWGGVRSNDGNRMSGGRFEAASPSDTRSGLNCQIRIFRATGGQRGSDRLFQISFRPRIFVPDSENNPHTAQISHACRPIYRSDIDSLYLAIY